MIDTNTSHIKDAIDLRREIAAGKLLCGVYGDAVGSLTFSDSESAALQAAFPSARWTTGWNKGVQWTLFDTGAPTPRELAADSNVARLAAADPLNTGDWEAARRREE